MEEIEKLYKRNLRKRIKYLKSRKTLDYVVTEFVVVEAYDIVNWLLDELIVDFTPEKLTKTVESVEEIIETCCKESIKEEDPEEAQINRQISRHLEEFLQSLCHLKESSFGEEDCL